MDSDFGEKLQDYLANGPPVNGEFNFLIGENTVHEEENKTENEQLNNGENAEEPADEEQQGISQENIPVEIAAAS